MIVVVIASMKPKGDFTEMELLVHQWIFFSSVWAVKAHPSLSLGQFLLCDVASAWTFPFDTSRFCNIPHWLFMISHDILHVFLVLGGGHEGVVLNHINEGFGWPLQWQGFVDFQAKEIVIKNFKLRFGVLKCPIDFCIKSVTWICESWFCLGSHKLWIMWHYHGSQLTDARAFAVPEVAGGAGFTHNGCRIASVVKPLFL